MSSDSLTTPETDLVALAGVTFQRLGKLHYYPVPPRMTLEIGDFVVAQTENGDDIGEVKILRDVAGSHADASHADARSPFRILRRPTPADDTRRTRHAETAARSLVEFQARADALFLPMKFVEAEIPLSAERITAYFVADERVDFRQLVKEMAARFRMRIHLHQVGARDHARALGGYGPCGRPLCCTTFLREFAPVTMRMAKDQSLYLNPTKFSGVCGKLMCCLRYEHDIYLDAKNELPQMNATVKTPDGGKGIVVELDYLRQKVTLKIAADDGDRFQTFTARELKPARACGSCGEIGGGCGDSCGGSCATEPNTNPAPIALEIRFKV